MSSTATNKGANEVDAFVGARVRMARVMANLSQQKLGDKLGVTFQQVQKYEKGANRIGASRLQQIARATEQPISYFFNGQESGDVGEAEQVITRMLGSPAGFKLATAFLAMGDGEQRRLITELATRLAQKGSAQH